jgi:hypothetical protein
LPPTHFKGTLSFPKTGSGWTQQTSEVWRFAQGNGFFVESCYEHVGEQTADKFTRYALTADGETAPRTMQQALGDWWRSSPSVRKTAFFKLHSLKTIILPRQALDKHRNFSAGACQALPAV